MSALARRCLFFFFFSSRRRHTRSDRDWSSDVCSSDLADVPEIDAEGAQLAVQMRALHADALGELSHLAVTQQQLLLQVGALELLARLEIGRASCRERV